MITLREKFEIEKVGFEEFYENLAPTKKIDLLRRAELPDDYKPELKTYETISSIVWGQLVLYEQTIPKDSKSLLERLKIIIRPLDEEIFDNEDSQKEDELSEAILNTPFQYIEKVLSAFEDSRKKVLFHQFNGVIYHKDDLEEKEEDDANIVDDAEQQFNKTWFWYSATRTLANEDITKMPEIYRSKAMDILVELAFRTQQQKIEKARNAQSGNV